MKGSYFVRKFNPYKIRVLLICGMYFKCFAQTSLSVKIVK